MSRHLGRRLYTLGLWLAAPLVLLRLLLRSRRQPEYRQHLAERFGSYPSPAAGAQAAASPVFWLHAVSVGETQAARPLVDALRSRYPDARIVLTHMTPTGRARAAELFAGSVESVYLPYDFPFAVRRFLRHFRPTLGMILETEIWPNLIALCREQSVPLHLVNARLSEQSAARYRRFPALTAGALRGFSSVLAQTEGDGEQLHALGAPRVSVTGNVKFDALPDPAQLALGRAWREQWPGRSVWVAASTREGEEVLVIDALRRVTAPDALLVLVPRHPQRFAEVAALLEQAGVGYARRSAAGGIEAAASIRIEVLLGDSLGEMTAWYASCDLAFIGGSLLPLGGQNLIEACAVARPTLIGPHTWNFREASDQAVAAGAALRVDDPADLAAAVSSLLFDRERCAQMGKAALAFAESHRGATERTLEHVLAGIDAPARQLSARTGHAARRPRLP
jgi:3-deoxy-D-manno-octulosonic-acid transferase